MTSIFKVVAITIIISLSCLVTPTTETPVQFAISVKLTGEKFSQFLMLTNSHKFS